MMLAALLGRQVFVVMMNETVQSPFSSSCRAITSSTFSGSSGLSMLLTSLQ
jgi:hypothetical protein